MYYVREWLYVGKYAHTCNLKLLRQVGIGAMLQLADYVPQTGIETLYLAVADGEPVPHNLFQQGIAFIREQKAQGKSVLVSCGAGISRSATFALAALMEEEQRTMYDAYREIYIKHRGAEPHFELIRSLSAYHGQDIDAVVAYQGFRDVRQSVDKTTWV